ncbi:class I SAM-dependent methyltransferase [Subsaximicrobium wynnwilliamsii]|uniref:Class I SAM-dependent methyltransferase n=1 Tax=Subsaximicrobium wynnwilliamsii TaxID=291179 RepID=A0A5C6ZHC8_9FLAO|nr:class I SAM-dependent methyltransferase [Subsaximicrobium wynnwilliamsii]TXD83350.1 class I SAM-dependent methyltransferase [Subsaximicrobium wynnwilliamsii]TXD89113.1 class I SAM-dependent methyltransferase [Subsaximicrobium wynnwilliamsii]TXE03374.1 class I SAM-dependent methyltransferase [Subsaximicrobium wynnwilliamsii]
MDKAYETHYHDLERSHFWFKARRNYILQLLKDVPKTANILDIGCSSGLLLTDLKNQGFNPNNLYGIDISKKAIANCKQNGLQNCAVMSADTIKLDLKFDVLIASDCLEHLQNDEKAVRNWRHLLKADGKLYIFVPAFQALWSQHDVINMHYRRYTEKQLLNLVTNNGFEQLKSGYWNALLFIPIYIARKLGKLKATKNETSKSNSSGDLETLPSLNPIFLGLLNFENRILKYVRFPFGVSTYCILAKAEKDSTR